VIERSILSEVSELGAVIAVSSEVPVVKFLSRSDRIKLLRPVLSQVGAVEIFEQTMGEESMQRAVASETRSVIEKRKHSRPRPSREKTQIREGRWKNLVAQATGNSQVEATSFGEIRMALLARNLEEIQALGKMSSSEINKLWRERNKEVDPFLLFICCRPVREAIVVLDDGGFGDLEKYFNRRFELGQQVEVGEITLSEALDEISRFNAQANFELTEITAPLFSDVAARFTFAPR